MVKPLDFQREMRNRVACPHGSRPQDRRTALWDVKALARRNRDSLPMEPPEPRQLFAPLDPAEIIRWDYRTTDLSPRGHPLEAVRARLCAQGLPNAAAVAKFPHGRRGTPGP